MSNNISYDLPVIVSKFCLEGNVGSIQRYGSGHINDTFRIENTNNDCPDYLLQRINHNVFKDPAGVTNNIIKITNHLKQKIQNVPGGDPTKHVLNPVATLNGGYFYKDADGNYWRVFYFVKDAKSYDIVETEEQAYEGGKAFGEFQAMLSDLNADEIIEPIPDFQNIEKRLQSFFKAIESDPLGRVKEVKAEIEFIGKRTELMSAVFSPELPKRIIHCDTKFNNVLLDENDKALCVIDLDTVMPGYVAYDFGDAIRTIINTAAEDEKDVWKIQLNFPLYAAYTKGYLKEAGSFLSATEIASLPKGVLLVTYMQVVRFLTDYIEGDTYYKISFHDHNLLRTRAQLQLFKQLEEQYERLEKIVQDSSRQVLDSVNDL
jgi:Ser/Thr protein kinase RdoA (MazF antagonist)